MDVDRILDMYRIAHNVAGDLVACPPLNRWLGEDARKSTSDLEGTGTGSL